MIRQRQLLNILLLLIVSLGKIHNLLLTFRNWYKQRIQMGLFLGKNIEEQLVMMEILMNLTKFKSKVDHFIIIHLYIIIHLSILSI